MVRPFFAFSRCWIQDASYFRDVDQDRASMIKNPIHSIKFYSYFFNNLAPPTFFIPMVIHNSFNDFVLFLYVHMANSDGESHDLEKGVILGKMTKLFPPESDLDKLFEDAVKQYRGIDKNNLKEIMRATFKHFDQVKFAQE